MGTVLGGEGPTAAKKRERAGRRTTVYRLTGVGELRQAVRSKYFERPGFNVADTTLAGRDALLMTGVMENDVAPWCSAVSALTDRTVTIGSKTPAGILVLRPSRVNDSGVAYALTYGMGFQLLESSRLDNLFGQRIAIRTVDPGKLRSITATTVDDRSRTSRSTIPRGDGLLGFGIGDIGEAVSRVVGTATVPHLSRSGGEPLQIRGADALNLPIGLTPDEVASDLDVLEELLVKDPHPTLKPLEQLAAVKNPETRELLEGRLSEALDGADERIELAWPHERVDENGTPDSWRATRLWPRGGSAVRQGQPDWTQIRGALGAYPAGMRLERARQARIQLFRDAEGADPISQEIPLRQWIAFETEIDGHFYALYGGGWYEIGTGYADRIDKKTQEIFDRTVDVVLPPWGLSADEAEYNQTLAREVGGVCLDRQLIITDLHQRGFEACDVYLPDGTLIHVKTVERSSAASHLLAQALVSAEALCADAQARTRLREQVRAKGGDPNGLDPRPKRVILAVHRSGPPLTATNLFTFTKVNLVSHESLLGQQGVGVFVAPIPHGPVPS